jgi:2,3-dihydroxybenzoate-AMP ligase/mycobactin salicyl-AMP ligase
MEMEGIPRHTEEESQKYLRKRWWSSITLADLFDKTTDVFWHKEGLVDDRVRLTYGELRDKVDRLAASFIDMGIEKGDRVLLQLPNWAEYVYTYFALQKAGAVPVLLLSGHRQLEVTHLCKLTGAKAWVVPEKYRKIDYTSFISQVKKDNPSLVHVISVRGEKSSKDFTASLEELMNRPLSPRDKERFETNRPEPTDVAHVLPSGGTTGVPKAIPRTHNDYICNVEYLHKGWEMCIHDTCLVAVPVGHNLALLNVVGSILVPYKLILLDSTRPDDICQVVEREKVTYMPTVPSLIKRILDFERLSDFNLTSLKKVSAGAEASTPELIREFYRKIGCTYINEFGMSEGLLCRTRLTDDIETVCSTVGKPCCPYEVVKIIDENGAELPPNTEGELAVKGPGIFAGYLKNEEENKRSFTQDRFFRTGDKALINEAGYIKIIGRIKDIIIRGGENISPAQVEELLRAHPSIVDAAVIGMPDRELGERVCAYVVLAEGVDLTADQIRVFMEEKGASKLLIPERFEFVASLPMTEAGKHDKKALREDIKKKIGWTG